MTNIALNSSMRSNLLSLQHTAKLQSLTQNRLSTGLKVNSAIDNASAFYTASSLNNRANDLSALLDSMAMGISSLKATSEALASSANFLEQASAVVLKASEKTVDIVAKVKTEQELLDAVASGKQGFIVIASDMNLNNAIVLKDGQSLVGDNYFAEYNGANRNLTFQNTIGGGLFAGSNSTISNLSITSKYQHAINVISKQNVTLANLNIDINFYNNTDYVNGISIMNSSDIIISGNINIKNECITRGTGMSVDKKSMVKITDANINIRTQGANGYGILNKGNLEISSKSVVNIETFGDIGYAVYVSQGTLNCSGTLNLKTNSNSNANGITVQTNAIINFNNANININSKSFGAVVTGSSINFNHSNLNIKSTYRGIEINQTADKFNSFVTLSNLSVAKIESATTSAIGLTSRYGAFSAFKVDGSSRLDLKTLANQSAINTNPIVGEVIIDIEKGANININRGTAGIWQYNFFDSYNMNITTAIAINAFPPDKANQSAGYDFVVPNLVLPDIDDTFVQPFTNKISIIDEQKQFNSILEQFDALINDSSYKGINLLQGQNLTINFNESRTSKIKISGVDASSKGLGMNKADWKTQGDITKSITEIASALQSIRSFQEEFGNQYSVVQNREEFTKNLINVLTEGADKLTLADMNQESANSLALDTRQQLATNALSLASQAAQSVLKLF